MKRAWSLFVRALVLAGGVLVPLFGFWVATSLAAYLNAPIALVIASGLVLCVGAPALIERWRAHQRRRHGHRAADTAEIAYRVFVDASRVSVVFVVLAFIFWPKTVHMAVSTRGDWMLEGASGDLVESAQRALFWVAARADGLFDDDNPFAEFDDSLKVEPGPRGWKLEREDDDEEPPAPPPKKKKEKAKRAPAPPPDAGFAERSRPDAGFRVPDAGFRVPDAGFQIPDAGFAPPPVVREEPRVPPPRPAAPRPDRYAAWMMASSPHRLVGAIPRSVETDWRSVAAWLAERERDPFERAKALHDYVVTRVDYQADYDMNALPPSDPDYTFERRLAVCAGYVRLFNAMAESVGYRTVYISGHARFTVDSLPGTSHAWSGVEIDGRWYLADPTWNAGSVNGRRFDKRYQTDYLFPPPEVFGLTHLPREPRWQLLATPISQGEFLRQPLLWPRFFAYGFELLDPTRSQVSVFAGAGDVSVDNPRERYMLAKFVSASNPNGPATRCAVEYPSGTIAVGCRLPGPGTYLVKLFGALEQDDLFRLIGLLQFNNRG